ncbi:MAG: HAD-IA family hydrolase [Gammaproteobacteria bacterium]|nr:HAD-IA family hydrolase [Gammaproteobacteria bacterium]
MTVNTILFDLDGTLIDTAPDLAYALNTLLLENGIDKKPYEKIKPLVAFGGKALIEYGFDCDESHPEFTNRHMRILEIYTHNIDKFSKTFGGIDTLLKTLKEQNLFWGIVTNKPEKLTNLLLEKLGLNPDVVVCGDTLEYNKPHPAPLLYACAQLGVSPQHCWFVGDDKNDIVAGKNANIKTIAVTYGYGEVGQDWGYDYLIKQPSEILELMNGNY